MTLIGTEQVDPAYISSTFHKDVPADPVRNSRRLSRIIFKTPPTQLLQACSLQQGERRRITLRCAIISKANNDLLSHTHQLHLSMDLPEHLPPSFRGACVKFDYSFQAEARYVLAVCVTRGYLTVSITSSQWHLHRLQLLVPASATVHQNLCLPPLM